MHVYYRAYTHPMHSVRNYAFSLVELSIVLVILGLLVGGVLSGQALIHAAELRAVTTESNKYTSAMHGFRDKYFARAGDMPNAFAFWGATCGTDATTISTGCNGNGDGIVDTMAGGGGLLGENIKAWEHLARAGLIEGSYNGVNVAGEFTATNIPASKSSPAYWDMNSFAHVSDIGMYQCPSGSVCLILGDIFFPGLPELDTLHRMALEDLWNIDKKSDDGHAATGNILGDYNDPCLGSFGPTDTTAPWGIGTPGYEPSTTGVCYMIFTIL